MHAIGYSYVTNYCYIFVVDMQLQDRCLYCELSQFCLSAGNRLVRNTIADG